EAAPKRFHDDHRLDRTAAETAVLLGKGDGEKSELGELFPVFVSIPGVVLGECLALFEFIAIADEAVDALFEKTLLFGEIEIHSCLPHPEERAEGARLEGPPYLRILRDAAWKVGYFRLSRQLSISGKPEIDWLLRMRWLGLLEPQYRLRDDVLLNLVRAAVDRDFARVEICRCDRRGPIG